MGVVGKCEGDCGRWLNPALETVFQYESGWAKMRDAGGTNALQLREASDRFLCNECMHKLKRVGHGQGSLL